MSWAKLDDRFHENRKIKRVWRRCPAALGLHVMALTYCAGHETDGLVDEEFVEEKMPKPRDRDRAVAALIEAGLWHEADDGWQVNNFLEFNPSREEAAEARRSKSEAGKKGAAARWADRQTDDSSQTGAIAGANGIAMPNDAPDPTRPQPLKENPSLAGGGLNATDESRPPQVEGSGSQRRAAA